MKSFEEIAHEIVPDEVVMALEDARCLYDYYVATTIALHKPEVRPEHWAALDEAGAKLEKLIGVPDEART